MAIRRRHAAKHVKVRRTLYDLVSKCFVCALAGDVRQSMLSECDFEAEARNIAEFSNYLERNGLERVATAPFVFRDLSTRRWEPLPAGTPLYHRMIDLASWHLVQYVWPCYQLAADAPRERFIAPAAHKHAATGRFIC